MQQLQSVIESAFERRADITPTSVDTETRDAINQVIAKLDSGELRVSEKIDGEWVTHQWLKKPFCSLSASMTIRSWKAQKHAFTTKCQ